jgi:hypothetical protein
MTRRACLLLAALAIAACLPPMNASAQAGAQPAPAAASATQDGPSSTWIVAGAAFATMHADCQTCEEETPYRHTTGVLGNFGLRVNSRMDAGAELFWVPLESGSGHINTTHIDGVAQFRPWGSKGFFVKGGAGMAFVRNWVDATGPNAINSKALSVVIGTGWVFRPAARFGVQVFASQHAAALGDVKTATADVADVIGNFWSIGAAIVFR